MGSALLDDAAIETREAGEATRVPDLSREPDLLRELDMLRQQGERQAMPPVSALRQQVAERVAAHRSRRMGAEAAHEASQAAPRTARSAKIAAAVAERYAQRQSYHDFLAAEAERAVQQAQATAEVAALNAQALAAAQQRLLDAIEREDERNEERCAGQEMDPPAAAARMEHESPAEPLLWAEPEQEARGALHGSSAGQRAFRPPQTRRKQMRRGHAAEPFGAYEAADAAAAASIPLDSTQAIAAGITIRLYRDETGATRVTLDPPAAASVSSSTAVAHLAAGMLSAEEARLLDEEIAFRREPVFEEPAGPAEALPANLIEFPRQLVAARKGRPRLAEGPLRAGTEAAADDEQLRIFEVDPEQIAATPEIHGEAEAIHAAQWTSIWLDSRPLTEVLPSAATAGGNEAAAASQARSRSFPTVASVQRRMAAVGINTAILGAAGAVFATAFLWTAAHAPWHGVGMSSTMAGTAYVFAGRAAILSVLPFAVCAFALLAALYQTLFFTLSTATPGMRAARIALCTFSDENPTRAAVRRRLPAVLLSTLPLGFGFLWALLDEERLSWHDRICRIYLRSY